MNADDERRSRVRVPAHGRLQGEVMVYQPMTVVNISYGGAQVETPFPLQLDSLHQFRLTLNDLSVIVRGRIAHCRVGDVRTDAALYRSGIEFVEPSAHASRAIASFVDTLASSSPRAGVVDGEIVDDGAG